MAEGLGLPQDWGVVIADVDPNGPGARAGLHPATSSDARRQTDGERAAIPRELLHARGRYARHARDLARRCAADGACDGCGADRMRPSGSRSTCRPEDHIVSRLGVLGAGSDERIARLLPLLRRREGVVVAAVSPAAPPSQQGSLRPGGRDPPGQSNRYQKSCRPARRGQRDQTWWRARRARSSARDD